MGGVGRRARGVDGAKCLGEGRVRLFGGPGNRSIQDGHGSSIHAR